ncbi:hemogen isoform X5 [Phyllobates terribilis]|uniref:hemogen isoform X5 n=1 Tax=Phyllobates terribilis TaxID=111132 RepID=UPI003CCAEA78
MRVQGLKMRKFTCFPNCEPLKSDYNKTFKRSRNAEKEERRDSSKRHLSVGFGRAGYQQTSEENQRNWSWKKKGSQGT